MKTFSFISKSLVFLSLSSSVAFAAPARINLPPGGSTNIGDTTVVCGGSVAAPALQLFECLTLVRSVFSKTPDYTPYRNQVQAADITQALLIAQEKAAATYSGHAADNQDLQIINKGCRLVNPFGQR